jgi:mannose-1-phosphate guanylyltransferase
VKAIVLVGGEGTRLRPLTFSTPKPLLPIANRPFLERQLDWLASHGVDEVVLSLGYLPDAFREHFPDGRHGDIRLTYAVEERPLGTAGGIRYAAGDADERVIVCNGDILTSLDLRAVVEFHLSTGAEATIALTRVSNPSAFGVVPTRDDGSVLAFVEKPPADAAPTDWINAGTYVLEPSVLERIPPRLSVSIERETFPRMLEDGRGLFAVHSDAYWLDIGTPANYVQANRDVIAGRASLGHTIAAEARERTPGIWVEGMCEIADDASLVPPVLVGAGARIESGALVADSVVGPGAVVEHAARVHGSVLHPKARVAASAVVVDSVVGPDALVDRDAGIADATLLGAGASVAAATHISAGRVPHEAPAEPDR